MPTSALSIALDVSCAAEVPVTGIGYAAIYQLRALFARNEPGMRFHLLAAGGRGGRTILRAELGTAHPLLFLPGARLAKYYAWTSLNWPPIEWFTGPARIAHNLCHQTPAVSRALKLVTVHDLSVFRFPETHTARMVHVQRTLLRHAAARADHLIAVSNHCKSEMVDVLNVSAERVHVIPNGVNTAEFDVPLDSHRLNELRLAYGLEGDYIIHLGTIEPRKNLVRLCDAYAQLRRCRGDVPKLVVVGAPGWGAGPSLRAIDDLGEHAVRPGYLSRADVVLLLRGARVCVYPSIYEGFGLPVLEAMAARTPIVAGNGSALPEVGGDSAIYADPIDPASIAHAIERVLDDPTATATRVAAGRQRAETMSWESAAAQLASLYKTLAN